jgi:hypothetical protein
MQREESGFYTTSILTSKLSASKAKLFDCIFTNFYLSNAVYDKLAAEYMECPLDLEGLDLTEMEGWGKGPKQSHLGSSTSLYLRNSTTI